MSLALQEEQENLWGYAKRLRFVRRAMADAFPARDAGSLRVLDVGCGNGSQLALPLALADGLQITGVDPDEPSIEHARRLAAGSANVRFVSGQVEQLSETELFDVVILSEVLEHTTEPRALLAASAAHMAEDGILIVTVPNGFGEFEIDSWVYRALRLQRLVDALARNRRAVLGSTDNDTSGHVQFFTRRRLRRLFAQCGLSVFREAAATLLAGPLVGITLARSARFIAWNARVTERLPLTLSSGWYFVLQRRHENSGRARGAAT
jgi:2-polyprenyl-3-methyl-5-hydroxy-6-metoxy-1,4-benzoquinol methylase